MIKPVHLLPGDPPRLRYPVLEGEASALSVGGNLRDFFIAQNGREVLQAYAGLRAAVEGMPAADDQDAMEFAYNRLFIGPRAPLAPPYASAYLDREKLVMRQVTLTVRNLYHAIGLTSPMEGVIPDDHLALEIDALLALHRARRPGAPQELAKAHRSFLEEHVLLWVPDFCRRVLDAAGIPDGIRAVARVLGAWLEQEQQTLNQGACP